MASLTKRPRAIDSRPRVFARSVALSVVLAACANGRVPAQSPPTPSARERLAQIRLELEARYLNNAAAFTAKDTAAVYALRAPEFHTETPDGVRHSFADMRAYTQRLLGMIERFDTLTFRIDSLTMRGDTAVAVTFQYSSRWQHVPGTPESERHRVAGAVLQREQWVPSARGWLLWRVDEVRDQGTWIDGVRRPPRTP